MKHIGEPAAAEAKRLRHRRFTWCRLRNDFVDMPLWRVVATGLRLPLYQVQAFVIRLESFANAAQPRGYVGDFNAAEFGAALGMPTEDAARIFEQLERDEVGWVVQSSIATFWERNPDQEDTSATERKQRERAFKAALKDLGGLARTGRIGQGVRLELEKELRALRDLARSGTLPWDEHRERQRQVLDRALSTGRGGHGGHDVTSAAAFERGSAPAGLSTGHVGHNVTPRDIVTVTPRAEHREEEDPVDNSGAPDRGGTAGSATSRAEPAEPTPTPEQWLNTEGLRIVVERMRVLPGVAGTKIQRWLREVGGGLETLAMMIDAARQQDAAGDAFEASIRAQIAQRRLDAQGPRLRLARTFGGGAA